MRKRINFYVDAEIAEELRRLSRETLVPVSALVRKFLKVGLEAHQKKLGWNTRKDKD